MRSTVVLPHPDGPTMTNNSPSPTSQIDVADRPVAGRKPFAQVPQFER